MKTFRQVFSEVAEPKGGDEKAFKDKHIVTKVDYPVDVDDQFTGGKTVKKTPKRKADLEAGEDELVYEASLDPVDPKELKGKHKDRKDKDIDNDGDEDDSDEYLHKRRKAIAAAMQKEETEELDEISTDTATRAYAARKSKAQSAASQGSMDYAKAQMAEARKTKAYIDKRESVEEDTMATPEGRKKIAADAVAHHKAMVKKWGISHPATKDAEAAANYHMKKAQADVRKTKANNDNREKAKRQRDLAQKARDKGDIETAQKHDAHAREFLTRKEAFNFTENAWEETPMMMRQLQFIAYAAEEIMEYLDMNVDPEEWYQNKLAQVHDQMQTLHSYMEGDKRMMTKMYGEEVEVLDEAFKQGIVKLKDGSSVILKKQDAGLLNQMFKDLSATNRKKMQSVAMTDKAGFEEILGFAREAL